MNRYGMRWCLRAKRWVYSCHHWRCNPMWGACGKCGKYHVLARGPWLTAVPCPGSKT